MSEKHANMTTMMFDRYKIDSFLYNMIHLQHDFELLSSTLVL